MLPHQICAPLRLLCFDASKCVRNAFVIRLFIFFLHNRGPCWTDGQMQKLYIFYTAKRIKKALKAANDSLVPATCGPELLLL